MSASAPDGAIRELRLFIEELCCNLVRFEHAAHDGVSPDEICINQEVDLGIPGAFADIRVLVPGRKPYFIEVKYGYPRDEIVSHVGRTYGPGSAHAAQAEKIESLDRQDIIELRQAIDRAKGRQAFGETITNDPLFGLPEQSDTCVEDSRACARAIVDIGNSVCNEWQRCIDHVQASGGCSHRHGTL